MSNISPEGDHECPPVSQGRPRHPRLCQREETTMPNISPEEETSCPPLSWGDHNTHLLCQKKETAIPEFSQKGEIIIVGLSQRRFP